MTKHQPTTKPILIVLSGPSGVGKDAVLARMKALTPDFHYTVTATTRPKREEEVEGDDYIFLNEKDFTERLNKNEFLEFAKVYGNFYGVPKHQVNKALGSGIDVVIKIDVQGAKTIKHHAPDGLFIFLTPPNMKSLENRLRLRMTESEKELNLRLSTANSEMQESSWFDLVIENPDDDLDFAVNGIVQAVKKEKRKNNLL